MDTKRSAKKRDRPACVRTKTGCLACRQRRKKCDEIRPVCSGCSRNFLKCERPPFLVAGKTSNGLRSSSKLVGRKGKQSALQSKSCVAPGTVTFIADRYSVQPPEREAVTPPNSIIDADSQDDRVEEMPESVIVWTPLAASFISAERALLLNPNSLLLLQHYVETTSLFLVARPPPSNPFITLVLPLAYSDDLLMHALLALSGTQLSFKKRDDLDIQLATRQHYSLLVRNLRTLFAEESAHSDVQRTLRLLLVLVVLCHVEAISGEPHGGIFLHLRASRELVLKLLLEPQNAVHNDTKTITGFALEVYFYLVLVNTITPYGSNKARALPLDAFFTPLDFLKDYQTYGVLLSCGHGIFELIPRVSILAMTRLTEEASGLCSPETQSTYEHLIESITEWQPPPIISEMAEWREEYAWAGEIYRQALFIFVKASMCGPVVSNPKVIIAIQRHIDITFPLLDPVSKSPLVTILLWPIMIIGSCLICESQRSVYVQMLVANRHVQVPQVPQAAKLLQRLWDDEDERAYGSFGLHLIIRRLSETFISYVVSRTILMRGVQQMEKHNINFSMA